MAMKNVTFVIDYYRCKAGTKQLSDFCYVPGPGRVKTESKI